MKKLQQGTLRFNLRMAATRYNDHHLWLCAMVLLAGLFGRELAFAQPFTVTNTQNMGAGSLRQAIIDANGNLGPDTINFDIPGIGPHVIAPTSEFEPIVETVLIDGYSQHDTLTNSAEQGSNAVIDIVLSGALLETFNKTGLNLVGGFSEVRGLIFVDWYNAVELGGVGGHVVRGNWFGVAPNGSAMANARAAIWVNSDNCVIGGPAADPPTLADRNLISNSGDMGIYVQLGRSGTRIQNNAIGVDTSGAGPGGNMKGIVILGIQSIIGGLGPLESNVIAWSRNAGVAMRHQGMDNAIRGNRIYNNGALGIDLLTNETFAREGVTENDGAPDEDTGANGQQNFPVLISAANGPGGITVTGTLDSALATTFDIDFYSNSVPDSGPFDSMGRPHGEGEAFLGTTQVTTNGAGHADFNIELTETAVGAWISSTATDPDGNTSEFSTVIPVPGENCTVTNTAASGAGSFHDCMDQVGNNGNNASEVDTVELNIKGGGVIPYDPTLAPFSTNIIIDFTTQPGFVPPATGVDPCSAGGTWPVTIEANPPDIDVFDGTIIIGMDLIGDTILKGAARGVSISESRMTATLNGAGSFVDGDYNSISNSVFVPFGPFPGLAVTGNGNRISDVCSDRGMGIFASAQNNTILRLQPSEPPDISVLMLGGTGNTISELRTLPGPPRAGEGPVAGVTIDLGGDGHTENDPLDADEGPNGLQNHPVIETVTTVGTSQEGAGQTQVHGVLDSEPNGDYRIEAYASAACAANDYGPAERFLGFVDVTTDAAGHTAFMLQSSESVAMGEVVVATATALDGSTSELSACVTVEMADPDLIFTGGFE